MSESRTQRNRAAVQDQDLDRLDDSPPHGSAAILATTTTVTTYPTTAAAFYAANMTEIDGVEQEGTAATYTIQSGVVYILNTGTQIPPVGTRVVAHAVGGRWVFRYDG